MNFITHSVMFHHFHNAKHPTTQGSLSSSDFIKMIDWLNNQYTILNAGDYKKKFENNTLKKTDICLSFDDALKCQIDIAAPVLEKLGIESFFFVYSSAFSNNPDFLEIYRYFRTVCYENIDEFYEDFFEILKNADGEKFSHQYSKYLSLNYLSAFPFYSENDKLFRYLRDKYLSRKQYNNIMSNLINRKDFDVNLAKRYLWMTEKDLVFLQSKGHIIGLHSYSHPTQMSKLSAKDQTLEYERNHEHLFEVLGKSINVMSHPCGDYNKTTLKILKDMNVDIGFRSNMSVKKIRSPLEIPREDSANVLKFMHE